MKNILVASLLVLGFVRVSAQDAGKGHLDMLRQIFYEIKSDKQLGFQFAMNVQFPNDQRDKLTGESYKDNEGRILYNSNNIQTVIYDKNWYYIANHKEKNIFVTDVRKHYNATQITDYENDIFGNGEFNFYLDSVITRNATVSEFKQKNDTVSFVLAFPDRMVIKNMSIDYDIKDKIPVRITMKIYTPWTGREKSLKNKGTTKIIYCKNYYRKIDRSKCDLKNYFSLANGKIVLKKYDKYQLHSKL